MTTTEKKYSPLIQAKLGLADKYCAAGPDGEEPSAARLVAAGFGPVSASGRRSDPRPRADPAEESPRQGRDVTS